MAVRRAGRVLMVLAGLAALFAGGVLAFRVHVAEPSHEAVLVAFDAEPGDEFVGELAGAFEVMGLSGRCGRPVVGAFRTGLDGRDVRFEGSDAYPDGSFDRLMDDLGMDETGDGLRDAVSDACRDDARRRLAVAVGLVVLGLETVYLGVARPTLRRERESEPSPPPPSPAPS